MMISEERRLYQELIGYQCSDNHWREVVKRLKNNDLEVNQENIKFYCSIKGSIPRSAIGLNNVLTLYSEVSKILNGNKVEKSGEYIKNLILSKGIKVPQPTFSRWFSSIGGFRKDKKYNGDQIKSIMLKALIYRAQYQTSDKLTGVMK